MNKLLVLCRQCWPVLEEILDLLFYQSFDGLPSDSERGEFAHSALDGCSDVVFGNRGGIPSLFRLYSRRQLSFDFFSQLGRLRPILVSLLQYPVHQPVWNRCDWHVAVVEIDFACVTY